MPPVSKGNYIQSYPRAGGVCGAVRFLARVLAKHALSLGRGRTMKG